MIDTIIMMLAVSLSAYIETQQAVSDKVFSANLLAEVNHHARGYGLGCTGDSEIITALTHIGHQVEVIAPNMHELIVSVTGCEVYTAQDVIHCIMEAESEAYLHDHVMNG